MDGTLRRDIVDLKLITRPFLTIWTTRKFIKWWILCFLTMLLKVFIPLKKRTHHFRMHIVHFLLLWWRYTHFLSDTSFLRKVFSLLWDPHSSNIDRICSFTIQWQSYRNKFGTQVGLFKSKVEFEDGIYVPIGTPKGTTNNKNLNNFSSTSQIFDRAQDL